MHHTNGRKEGSWILSGAPKSISLKNLANFCYIKFYTLVTQSIIAKLDSFMHYVSYPLLGRLPKVDLIILEGGGMSVRPSVRPYVRPQKVSSISMKFGIQVEVDE